MDIEGVENMRMPEMLDNVSKTVKDDLAETIAKGDRLSVAAACFSIAERKPLRAVFRDSGFTSSPEKINVFEIFKLLAPNTNVKVI